MESDKTEECATSSDVCKVGCPRAPSYYKFKTFGSCDEPDPEVQCIDIVYTDRDNPPEEEPTAEDTSVAIAAIDWLKKRKARETSSILIKTIVASLIAVLVLFALVVLMTRIFLIDSFEYTDSNFIANDYRNVGAADESSTTTIAAIEAQHLALNETSFGTTDSTSHSITPGDKFKKLQRRLHRLLQTYTKVTINLILDDIQKSINQSEPRRVKRQAVRNVNFFKPMPIQPHRKVYGGSVPNFNINITIDNFLNDKSNRSDSKLKPNLGTRAKPINPSNSSHSISATTIKNHTVVGAKSRPTLPTLKPLPRLTLPTLAPITLKAKHKPTPKPLPNRTPPTLPTTLPVLIHKKTTTTTKVHEKATTITTTTPTSPKFKSRSEPNSTRRMFKTSTITSTVAPFEMTTLEDNLLNVTMYGRNNVSTGSLHSNGKKLHTNSLFNNTIHLNDTISNTTSSILNNTESLNNNNPILSNSNPILLNNTTGAVSNNDAGSKNSNNATISNNPAFDNGTGFVNNSDSTNLNRIVPKIPPTTIRPTSPNPKPIITQTPRIITTNTAATTTTIALKTTPRVEYTQQTTQFTLAYTQKSKPIIVNTPLINSTIHPISNLTTPSNSTILPPTILHPVNGSIKTIEELTIIKKRNGSQEEAKTTLNPVTKSNVIMVIPKKTTVSISTTAKSPNGFVVKFDPLPLAPIVTKRNFVVSTVPNVRMATRPIHDRVYGGNSKVFYKPKPKTGRRRRPKDL